MSKNRICIAFVLICTGVIGGFSPIFMKIALKEFSPIQIVFTRFFFASLILLPLAVATKNISFKKQDIGHIVFASLLFAINVIFYVIGLQNTTSIASQLMYLLTPAFIIMITFVLGQSPTKKQILSIIMGFLGGLVLVGKNNSDGLIHSLGTTQGNIIVLIAVFSWALYAIVSKKLSSRYSPLSLLLVNSLMTGVIATVMLVFLRTNIINLYSHASPGSILSLFILIILNSVSFFFLFQWALKSASPFTVSLTTYLGPLAAATLAIPLFGEQITPQLIFSAILIGASSYLTLKKK